MKTKSDCILEFIPLSIYDGFLLFTCGFTHTEIIRILKKQKASGWEAAIRTEKSLFESSYMCAGIVTAINPATKKECDYVYMHLKNQFTFTDNEYSQLAHECFHICQFYLPTLGIDIVREKESSAYFHTYLMDKCLKSLRK